jgi:hypothetical protein
VIAGGFVLVARWLPGEPGRAGPASLACSAALAEGGFLYPMEARQSDKGGRPRRIGRDLRFQLW